MSNRNTMFVEDAEVISHKAYAGGQYVLRVKSPEIARRAEPGSFVHVSCSPALPMRRPLSIMLTQDEYVDFLYKVVGEGTRLLAQRTPGETISMIGPIGVPFSPESTRPRTLLIGGGVGIPPMVFLAQRLAGLARAGEFKPFAILGSEVPFPFDSQPSKIIVPNMPDGVIASMPLLDDWGIASRLASLQGYAGCYEGYVTDLARLWLQGLTEQQRSEVEIFSCGPHPMLEAVASLAREFQLPCQVSLEEFMACAVGGCAGCVVKVKTDTGTEMKRVCVDGPVFEASQVF